MDRLAQHPELIDGEDPDPALLRKSLNDLRRINRRLGGVALSAAATRVFARDGAPLRMLDVGTGLADIPVALLAWAGRERVPLEVEATDSRVEMIAAAGEAYPDVAGLLLRVADGRALPYSDAAFDVAHTSLMAHHLEPDELLASLGELRRVSRLGVIVNDLDRNPVALAGAWLFGALFATSSLTRNDAPLSVRRAYRPDELVGIAAAAGLREAARFRSILGYRYAVVFVASGRTPASE